jgi:KaiC/GvpD/RAD55 family RecA-like ATPase
MNKNIILMKSGIDLVDQAWGGFYKGGTYILQGPHKSGRTLLGLQSAMQAVNQKEICLYFTTMRPKDLMIQAASIGFDLQMYMNQNLIIVVRVASPVDISEMKNPDEYLKEYFTDIVKVIQQYNPNRIIFDELTPYLSFSNINYLNNVFIQTLETIEEKNVISLFILGEPITPLAEAISESLGQQVTGTIYLQKKSQKAEGKFQGGVITIIPNIGHNEGQFSANYNIEPNKGIVAEYRKSSLSKNLPLQPEYHFPSIENIPAFTQQISNQEHRYLSLSSLDLPSEPYSFSNLYDYNDFLLILNNQIALFKSTGQIFNIVSFKLDLNAVQNGLITLNQLQNAVRLASDKKDKICIKDNKVIILITRGDKKAVQNIISKIQNNLPSTNPEYIRLVLNYISVLSFEIDNKIENADSLMNYIVLEEDVFQNNKDITEKF